ncbi:MAG: hypothetical protein ACLFU2_13915, partial [Opitutales bacterium]
MAAAQLKFVGKSLDRRIASGKELKNEVVALVGNLVRCHLAPPRRIEALACAPIGERHQFRLEGLPLAPDEVSIDVIEGGSGRDPDTVIVHYLHDRIEVAEAARERALPPVVLCRVEHEQPTLMHRPEHALRVLVDPHDIERRRVEHPLERGRINETVCPLVEEHALLPIATENDEVSD